MACIIFIFTLYYNIIIKYSYTFDVKVNSPDTRESLQNSGAYDYHKWNHYYTYNNKNNGPRRRYYIHHIHIKLLRRIKILLLLLLLPRRVQRGACLMAFQ